MPFRLYCLSALRVRHGEYHGSPRQALFHTLAALRADSTANYYDILDLTPTASPGDIKKKFYTLSKSHHPDLHPDDPKASERFVEISEAYATLGNAQKRERYDRDNIRHRSTPGRSRAGQATSSTGPAGGRPASGLSRRRTHFRGPPPSFYRNGGWGNQRERRQSQADASANASHGSSGGGFAPGEGQRGSDDDLPHFDRHGHTRTQDHQDWRRQRRTAGEYVPQEYPGSVLRNFLFVGGIITLAVGLSSAASSTFQKRPRENS